jgi:hypothetical protein
MQTNTIIPMRESLDEVELTGLIPKEELASESKQDSKNEYVIVDNEGG